MKKPKVLTVACAVVLLASAALALFTAGKKPFQRLDPAEIVSATVRLTPPDKTLQITELNELAGYLNDVVIYNQDQSYTEYSGQGVTFTLTMADGTQTEVMAYNPFLVIDGVGYKTKYAPCEALNRYANRLLNEKSAPVVLDRPPALDIVSDQTVETALLGTYSWTRSNGDGTFTGIEACGGGFSAVWDMLVSLETTESTAALRFTEDPDRILSARCQSDGAYRFGLYAPIEDAVLNGCELQLKPGGYLYEVEAQWDSTLGGGTAYYYFYILYQDA